MEGRRERDAIVGRVGSPREGGAGWGHRVVGSGHGVCALCPRLRSHDVEIISGSGRDRAGRRGAGWRRVGTSGSRGQVCTVRPYSTAVRDGKGMTMTARARIYGTSMLCSFHKPD